MEIVDVTSKRGKFSLLAKTETCTLLETYLFKPG